MCVCVPEEIRRGCQNPRTGVVGGCKSHDIRAGSQDSRPLENEQAQVTAEPSPWPFGFLI